MSEHLTKIHKLSKATAQSSSSPVSQIPSTTSGIQDNARSMLIPIKLEQYSKTFKAEVAVAESISDLEGAMNL